MNDTIEIKIQVVQFFSIGVRSGSVDGVCNTLYLIWCLFYDRRNDLEMFNTDYSAAEVNFVCLTLGYFLVSHLNNAGTPMMASRVSSGVHGSED